MSQTDSDSDSLDSGSDIDLEEATLARECINDFQNKREATRKKRVDAMSEKETIIVSQETLKNIQLTKKQIAQIKREQKEKDQLEKKERTEKQKKHIAELNEKKRKELDLRKSKEEEGITLKIKKTQVRKKDVPKKEIKVKEVIISDDEEEEEEKPKKFQGKKPKLDDIEEKVQKIKMINEVIENPYLAMILKSRKNAKNPWQSQ
jgi:hypothetical protein